MIVVKIQGGLGNQMFQYALGKKLSLLKNTKLKLDLTHYEKEQTTERTIRNFELNIFNIQLLIATKTDIQIAKGQNKPVLYRKLFNFNERYKKHYKKQTITEQNKNFIPSIFKIKKKCHLTGFWQTEKYFSDIRKILLNDFTFVEKLDHENKKILKVIKNTNSVSIHIRRGDYINNQHYKNIHINLNSDYYLKAISIIKKEILNPMFFFFSDDIEFVKKEYSEIKSSYFIDFNNKKNYNDMRLMTNCKHNIIANSSFSWWGAWLNQNSEKIVISPSIWYKLKEFNTLDLIPEDWIKI